MGRELKDIEKFDNLGTSDWWKDPLRGGVSMAASAALYALRLKRMEGAERYKDVVYGNGQASVNNIFTLQIPGKKDTEVELKDVTVNIIQDKIISDTNIQGNFGTVKEYINDGDYVLKFTCGISLGYNNMAIGYDMSMSDYYPDEEVKKLIQLCQNAGPLQVTNDFLKLFGIARIVVIKYEIDQQTYSNRQMLVVTAKSDKDYDVKQINY